MKRPLPTAAEAAAILAAKRTRPARRAPPPAGKKLTALVKSLDERFGQGIGGLAARWREIVGETLARTTEPVKVVRLRSGAGNVLEIRVDGPAAALIQHQAPQILQRANFFLGEDAVTRLRVVQGPVRAHATPSIGHVRRRKPPLDAGAEAELEAGLGDMEDERLKSSLLKLGRHVMRGQTAR